MQVVSVLGIDLAKDVFQLHGVNKEGRKLLSKRVSRQRLLTEVGKIPPCLIAMEACGTSSYWARQFRRQGHEVRLIAPQYVKPFVKTNKNDERDAEAICEAAVRPSMRFVPVKEVEQQDVQSLHRIRQGLIRQRVALTNEARGLFAEYGVSLARGSKAFKEGLKRVVEGGTGGIAEVSPLMRREAMRMLTRFFELQRELDEYDRELEKMSKDNPLCRRLLAIRGVGPLSATAVVASIGNAKSFKNGRQFAAWAGLVPKQSSSGNKQVLLGISKRGDRYLRTLLIHGARASLVVKTKCPNRVSVWAERVVERRGMNKAAVALANKNARMIWAVLAKGEDYQVSAA
jgi:transposase